MNSTTNQSQGGFFFLFRTDKGRITRATWWKGMAIIAPPLVLMTAGWIALSPSSPRDPSPRALIGSTLVLIYIYALLYAFAVIMGAICFYNLSAKRFQDRLLPRSLGGLLPFGLLLAGASHWIQSRSQGGEPALVPFAIDAIVGLIALWTIFELGFRPGQEDDPP